MINNVDSVQEVFYELQSEIYTYFVLCIDPCSFNFSNLSISNLSRVLDLAKYRSEEHIFQLVSELEFELGKLFEELDTKKQRTDDRV